MNAVERGKILFLRGDLFTHAFIVVHYSRADFIEQEAPHETEVKPPPEWPQHGAIEFKDVEMKYRAGLPNVLHGISMVEDAASLKMSISDIETDHKAR